MNTTAATEALANLVGARHHCRPPGRIPAGILRRKTLDLGQQHRPQMARVALRDLGRPAFPDG